MPTLKGLAARAGPQLAALLILVAPALWNGFPLLQYDTGGYLARWFEGTLVPSRSTTYGLFLNAGEALSFWPIVVIQAAAAVWIIGMILRIHRFRGRTPALFLVVAALAATTALPWLASVLLTDVFAGLAVLGFHLAVWHGHRIAPLERAALVVFVAFAISTHSATCAVLLVLSVAATIVSLFARKEVPRAAAARGIAAVAFGALLLLAGNYVVARRIAWTPGGYGIVFGRMLQDGIVNRYLDDHCPDSRLRLCAYRDQLPRDADDFLWGGGIFDRLGRFAGLGDEMRTIVLGSLRDYPLLQIKAAVAATAKQLVTVATGEGIGTSAWHTYGMIERHVPNAVPAMRAARQQRGEMAFTALNRIHQPVAWAAMALLPGLVLLGLWRADFSDIGRLSVTVAIALLANAAVCGIISNPHDRYGSRMVWIAALAVVLAAWRGWVTRTQSRTRSVPEVL